MSTAADFAAAAQQMAAACRAACADPADALRMLTRLADFYPHEATSPSLIGRAMAAMQAAAGDLFRRAAVVALARACASYQPVSYEDAVAARTRIGALLEAEMTCAADQGEDASFIALRALQAAVARDLTARGANLARNRTVAMNETLPALVLAQRLYRDASRADELVRRAAPKHPAFMPLEFKALSQ